MRNRSNAALFVVMALWGAHLGYPMSSLQYVRWNFFGYSVPSYYFFTVFLMLGAAILVLSDRRPWSKWEGFWWALPLICLPGIFCSSDRIWSLRQWFSWIIRGAIPGGVIFMAARRKKGGALLVSWIYPIVIAASVLGLVEIFGNYNPIWKGFNNVIPDTAQPANPFYRPNYEMAPAEAPRGTQGNRIPFAASLVGFLPLGFWLLRYKKKYFLINGIAISLLFSILLLARVRAVWLGTGVAIALMPLVGLCRNRREIAKILAGTMVGLCIFVATPRTRQILWPRFNSFHLSEGSIRNRLELLKTGAILKDRGLFGVGFGQYAVACDPYYHGDRWLPYFRGQTWIGTPDNQYLRWAIENGLPSLALLIVFFCGLMWAGWEKIATMDDVEQADFYKSILVGWVSIAVTFFFFDGFYWGACSMTFWCFLGLFAACLS